MQLTRLVLPLLLVLGTGAASAQQSAAPDAPAADAPDASAVTPLAAVETRGSGDQHLILIPGLSCTWEVWSDFMDRHDGPDRPFTMHAVTLPGMGGTDAPPMPDESAGTPWLDNAVKAVAKLIEDNNVEDPIVIGHSLGGIVAYRLRSEHPDKVAAAISVDGLPAWPLGPNPVPKQQRTQMADMMAMQMQQITADQWTQQIDALAEQWMPNADRRSEYAAMFRSTPKDVALQYMLELVRTDVSDQLAGDKADHKILAIGAVNDEGAAMGFGADQVKDLWGRMLETADGVQLNFIDDTTHFIMLEDPEAFDAMVVDFVDRDGMPKADAGAGAETRPSDS